MKKSEAVVKLFRYLITDRAPIRKKLFNHVRERAGKDDVIGVHGRKTLPYVDLLDLLPSEGESIHHYTFLKGSSPIPDIALVKAMCRRFEEADFLEIGTQRGETIVNVADVARSCTSLSLPDEDVRKAMGEQAAAMQRLFSDDVPNIQHIHHDSKTFDFEKLDRKFDVIFIDGDYSYEGVRSDTENAFRSLKDEHSVIIWHDFAKNFEDLRFEVINAALDGCPSEQERNRVFRVSNTVCGIYLPKGDQEARELETPHPPDKVFDITLKGRKLS